MKKKVIKTLKLFLATLHRPITALDKKVVEFFVKNPDIFTRFQNGCHYTKWEIYQAIRYGNGMQLAL